MCPDIEDKAHWNKWANRTVDLREPFRREITPALTFKRAFCRGHGYCKELLWNPLDVANAVDSVVLHTSSRSRRQYCARSACIICSRGSSRSAAQVRSRHTDFNITATNIDGLPETLQKARLAQQVQARVHVSSGEAAFQSANSSRIAGSEKSEEGLEATKGD